MLRRSMSFATDKVKGLEFISYVAHRHVRAADAAHGRS